MAIEAKDFTEKDELIAKFYTIRAGLSAIAEESEKIRDAENKVATLKREDEKDKKEIANDVNSKKWSIRETEDSLDYFQKQLDFLHRQKEALHSGGSKKYRPKLRSDFMIIGCIFGTILIWLIAVAVLCSGVHSEAEFAFFVYILPIMFILTVITPCKTWQRKKGDKILAALISEKEEEIKCKKNHIQKTAKSLEEKRRELYEIENKQLPAIVSSNSEKIAALEKVGSAIIYEATTKSKAIRGSLLEEYGHIITEDDWENIDLLIFYLNTGRADSLKEALQLVDRQRQTDQIADAIDTAASYISNTIETNTYKLARVMDNCFSKLSNQIDRNHQELLSSVNSMSGNLNSNLSSLTSTMRKQGEALLDAQALNASLLKASNQSSENLMYELRYNQEYWLK